MTQRRSMLAVALAIAAFAPTVRTAQAAPAPVRGAPAKSHGDDAAAVQRASDLIGDAKPAEAVALLDPLIADQERRLAAETRRVYCARSPAEGLIYALKAAREKVGAVVLNQSACYLLYLKAFALIDLDRSDEAKGWLERAVSMAPSNAQFVGELGEWYKVRKDYPKARALFERAVDAAEVSPPDRRTFDKSRAWRGLGYILIEDGKLDAAEALYRQCLQLDPKDTRAQGQLDYIAKQRTAKK